MSSILIRVLELFVLFIILPLSLLCNYPVSIKGGLMVLGFAYILFYLKRNNFLKIKFPDNRFWKPFWKETFVKLSVIIVITSLYVFLVAPDKLFFVLIQKPALWVAILFIYTFLSVWPQEIIYRTFFMLDIKIFLKVNGCLFLLMHYFFR